MHLFEKRLVTTIVLVFSMLLSLSAQNSQTIELTGKLVDADGNAVGDEAPALLDVSVSLFDAPSDGTACYNETFLIAQSQGIRVTDGRMTVQLGSGTSQDNLAEVIDTHENLWVEMTVDGDVLSRAPLTASPYTPSNTQSSINVSIRSNQ
ncbi:MAG: hypothetical protein ACOC4C_04665 [Fibrobacterota bacterium]